MAGWSMAFQRYGIIVTVILALIRQGAQGDPGVRGELIEERPPSLVLKPCSRPHVIAHRGASGYVPEHTLQAYRLAIDMGVDYIEPDLVLTKDGHLICRHDVDLSETTDVASRPEFRDRKRNITLTSIFNGPDGSGKQQFTFSGFFSFDFTLAEIKTLRARQRLQVVRTSIYDGLFEVPTLQEVVDMVREAEKTTDRPIGIYAEVKEPRLFELQGFNITGALVDSLHKTGLSTPVAPASRDPDGPVPIIVQCFDPIALRTLARLLPTVPLVQLLLAPKDAERDSIMGHLGRGLVYGEVPLAEIARYAQGIGPHKGVYTEVSSEEARARVAEAHELNLAVHPWTFRKEPAFVDDVFKGDSDHETRYFYSCLGVDALFVESPDQTLQIIAEMMRQDSDYRKQNGAPLLGGGMFAMAVSDTDFSSAVGTKQEIATRSCVAMRELRSCSLEVRAGESSPPRWLRKKTTVSSSI